MSNPDVPFELGMRVRFADDVELGALIYFDTVSEPGIVLVRRLAEREVPGCTSSVYRLEQSETPGKVRFSPVNVWLPGDDAI